MGISIAAVISAAGSSSRMGGVKKEYLFLEPPLPGKKPVTVLAAAFGVFASCPLVGPIAIVAPPDSKKEEVIALAGLPEDLLSRKGRPVLFVPGGPTRRASVHNALLALKAHSPSYALIHDGARPWTSRALVERVIEAAIRYGAAIPALPLIETPKEIALSPAPGAGSPPGDPGLTGFIKRHLRRAELCGAQTPQGFRFPEILRAHEKAKEREEKEGFEYTDDAEVWGEFIGPVAAIAGESENRKITYPEDLRLPPGPAAPHPAAAETAAERRDAPC